MNNLENQDMETGHVDYWQTLQSQHKELRNYPYDYIPRGRVLLKDEEIIVYSSNDVINDKKSRGLIIKDFELNDPKFVYDEHYRKILDLGFEEEF